MHFGKIRYRRIIRCNIFYNMRIMSKPSLFLVVLLSSLCGISILSSGCGNSNKEEPNSRSRSTKATTSRQIVVKPHSSPAQPAKIHERPPAQLLTTAKQAELPPPVEQTASPS